MPEADAEVWVVMYADMSSVVIFEHEIDALRYAVENSMTTVKRVTFGEPLKP